MGPGERALPGPIQEAIVLPVAALLVAAVGVGILLPLRSAGLVLRTAILTRHLFPAALLSLLLTRIRPLPAALLGVLRLLLRVLLLSTGGVLVAIRIVHAIPPGQ